MNDFELVNILGLWRVEGAIYLIEVLAFILREYKIISLFLNCSLWCLRDVSIPLLIYKFYLNILVELNQLVILDLTQLRRSVQIEWPLKTLFWSEFSNQSLLLIPIIDYHIHYIDSSITI